MMSDRTRAFAEFSLTESYIFPSRACLTITVGGGVEDFTLERHFNSLHSDYWQGAAGGQLLFEAAAEEPESPWPKTEVALSKLFDPLAAVLILGELQQTYVDVERELNHISRWSKKHGDALGRDTTARAAVKNKAVTLL